jgi:microsomal dipeptidase-like Zn-dependent dipeptidase
MQRLSALLQKRGWSTTQLEKLLGRNLQRLFQQAWA